MNTAKITIKALTACLCLTLAFSCSDNNKDSKEQAEEVNEDKFNKEGEKEADRLVEAYAANLYEIRASEAAVSRASTAEVKKLAAMMVEAHTKMNAEIQRLASSKNVTLPTDVTDENRRKMDNLNEKSGLDYDKEYLDQMENKHDESIRKCENTADKSDDAELKQWASQSLPEIRSHKDMIESTKNIVKDMKDNTSNKDLKDMKDNKTTNERH
jgi:putative membrane protein